MRPSEGMDNKHFESREAMQAFAEANLPANVKVTGGAGETNGN